MQFILYFKHDANKQTVMYLIYALIKKTGQLQLQFYQGYMFIYRQVLHQLNYAGELLSTL